MRIHADSVHLTVPVPLYVLSDLFVAWEDLCEVILPRFGLPNYAQALHTFVASLIDLPVDTPLVEVRDGETEVIVKRVG